MNRKYLILIGFIGIFSAVVWLVGTMLTNPKTTEANKSKPKKQSASQSSDSNNLPQPIFSQKPAEEVLEKKTEEGRQSQIGQIKEFASAFDTPIDFWGKVVDEGGSPIVGASVKLGAADFPFSTGTIYEKITDANGLFSVREAKGLSISVNVSKEGYYQTSRSRGQVNYAHASENSEQLPTSDKPSVFVLQRKGETEPLIRIEQSVRISKDGTPITVDMMTGRLSPSGNFRVEAWTQAPEGNREFTWRCRVTVPGGGLVERKEPFDFEAHESGYEESKEFGMSKDSEQWTSQQQHDYFAKLPDGRYARINFRMIAGGNHYFILESYLNPTPGRRNLEYDPAKRVNP